ncbi:MAG: hypothetical protein AAF380_03130, partial [Bacteroidota bacterium]
REQRHQGKTWTHNRRVDYAGFAAGKARRQAPTIKNSNQDKEFLALYKANYTQIAKYEDLKRVS